ncbi:MAG: DNA polymerase III subunit gamma/tau [Planctomycetales bacterium]|nr:DNA polymerase III subunit gamma/tau [Planctomycetales bacterium]
MSYTVIARRYRSQTFDDVVGQDAVARTLKNAIQMGRVAHAYLFCGTRGVGKTTMARILAKSLNCLKADGPTITPCLKCDSCVSVNTGDDIDVVEIDGASNNKVENVRELISNAVYRPARARFKIYIIDEVHMLTDSAFNSLLKTLEEPPDHVKFIFATTEPNKVLATIQSRCQRFDFQHISAEVIGQQLEKILRDEKIKYEKDLIVYLSRLADGSMRDALSLLDQLISSGVQPLTAGQLSELMGVPDRQKVLNLLTAIAGHDGAAALEAIDHLLQSGQSSVQICDLLIEHMRDIMVFRCAGPDSRVLVLTREEKQQLGQIAEAFDIASLVYNITALEKLRWTLRNSETSRALLEASLLRLALSEHFIGLDQLRGQLGGGSSAKKKWITDSPAAPPGLAPAPSSPHPSVTIQPDLDSLASSWQALVAQCAQTDAGLGAFLAQAHPVSYRDSVLLIQFGRNGQGQLAKNMCERKLETVEKIISQDVGATVKVRTELGDEKAAAPEKKAAVPAELALPVNRQQRQEVLNDPAVQMVLKGLDASPVEIQKVDTVEETADTEGILPEGME